MSAEVPYLVSWVCLSLGQMLKKFSANEQNISSTKRCLYTNPQTVNRFLLLLMMSGAAMTAVVMIITVHYKS